MQELKGPALDAEKVAKRASADLAATSGGLAKSLLVVVVELLLLRGCTIARPVPLRAAQKAPLLLR